MFSKTDFLIFVLSCFDTAGAMRLPCEPDAENKTHFLTDFYASERFKLTLAHFSNYSEDTYLKFYNEKAVRRKGTHNPT